MASFRDRQGTPQSSPRWPRYAVVAAIVVILLSIPWTTWLVLQNLRESEKTLQALSKPDAVRLVLERFDRSLAGAGTAVLHHASTVDRRDRAAYRVERGRSDSLFRVLEREVGNEEGLPSPDLDPAKEAHWLGRLDSLRGVKFALLDEWVRFARTREGINTDNIDALLQEAQTLTQDTVLDAGAKRIKKKEYEGILAQEDSLRDVRLAKLGELQSQLEGLPKAIVALTEARQRKAARLARQSVEIDLELREVLDQWFQYRASLEPLLVAQRQANMADWQRGLWVMAVSASAMLFALGLVLTVLFRRTDRVQAALSRTLAQERALVAAREAFLANMSHEIRTPLHAIGGFAERLGRSETPAVQEQAGLIQEAGTHLLDLVNHILDYARLRGQPGNARKEPFSPEAVLHAAADLLRPRAEEKALEVLVENGSNVPAALFGDQLRLRQILLNLGANAIKYTESGSIRLHATGQALADQRFRLVLEVEDTGPGISAAEQERIFEPFRQLQGERQADAKEGLGLGLAIVAELCAQLDAKMDLDSTPGRGSLFRVSLVLPPAKEQDLAVSEQHLSSLQAELPVRMQHAAHDAMAKKSEGPWFILAADDEAFNRRLLAAQIQDHPAAHSGQLRFEAADGGEAAWAIVEAEDHAPDLLLLDWRMPDLDGVALLQRVRRRHKDVPAVALTAQADDAARKVLLEAGFDAVLEKPFGQAALFALLESMLGLPGAAVDGPRTNAPSTDDPGSNGPRTNAPRTDAPPTDVPSNGDGPASTSRPTMDAAEQIDPGALDLHDLEALADGDGTFVADMLEIFLERLQATRQDWEEAIENKDRKAIAESAHKLAAPARQLGFSELAAALRGLEQDADGQTSIAALANRCRRLQPMLQTAQLQVAAKLEEGLQA